jgi:hypothetical protein
VHNGMRAMAWMTSRGLLDTKRNVRRKIRIERIVWTIYHQGISYHARVNPGRGRTMKL